MYLVSCLNVGRLLFSCGLDAFMQRIGRVARSPSEIGERWLIVEPWAWDGVGGTTGTSSRKSSDPILRGLVTEDECRRKHLNRVYANPPSGEHNPPSF